MGTECNHVLQQPLGGYVGGREEHLDRQKVVETDESNQREREWSRRWREEG
jgi:hypothetical protein